MPKRYSYKPNVEEILSLETKDGRTIAEQFKAGALDMFEEEGAEEPPDENLIIEALTNAGLIKLAKGENHKVDELASYLRASNYIRSLIAQVFDSMKPAKNDPPKLYHKEGGAEGLLEEYEIELSKKGMDIVKSMETYGFHLDFCVPMGEMDIFTQHIKDGHEVVDAKLKGKGIVHLVFLRNEH